MFVVEKGMAGFSLGQQIKNKLGMRSSGTAELVFEDVEIPAENRIDVENVVSRGGIRRTFEHDIVKFGQILVHSEFFEFLFEQILLFEPGPRRIHLPQVPANHRVGGNSRLPRAHHALPLRMHVEVARADIQKLH